ncbi:MAG TPA: MFS transporter, partial [Chloroflexota bacterium]|nr:MFS transporter [Chloroflexota bacterium]
QIEAREELRGRVLSLYMFLMVGSTPFGSAITGFVANTFDVRLALQINGALCLGGLAVAAVLLRRRSALRA